MSRLVFFFVCGALSLQAQSHVLEALGPHGSLSYCFYDLDAEKVIIENNEKLLNPPASTLKLITAILALEYLGPNYRYKTHLHADGYRQGHRWVGNLTVRGSGDPSIASRYLLKDQRIAFEKALIEVLASKNIESVTGDLIMDISFFDNHPQVGQRLYEDIGNYYGAGIWPLNFHDNSIHYFFESTNDLGGRTRINAVKPSMMNALPVVNNVVVGPRGSGDQAYFYAGPNATELYVEGSIPPGQKSFLVRSAMPQVPLYFGRYIKGTLAKAGIDLKGEVRCVRESAGEKIHWLTYSSPPLIELIKLANHHSINLYSEAFVRTLGRLFGKSDVMTSCTDKGLDLLINKEGIEDQKFHHWQLYDGSGLSPLNGVDARSFVRLLEYYWSIPEQREWIVQILPMMGIGGNLRGLVGTHSPIYGKAYVKSGTLAHTKAYSGYLKAQSGHWLAFYINAHRFPVDDSGKVSRALIQWMEEVSQNN